MSRVPAEVDASPETVVAYRALAPFAPERSKALVERILERTELTRTLSFRSCSRAEAGRRTDLRSPRWHSLAQKGSVISRCYTGLVLALQRFNAHDRIPRFASPRSHGGLRRS
jgi:hypothetical protein